MKQVTVRRICVVAGLWLVTLFTSGCRTTGGKTEVRLFHPTILRAHVVDAQGNRVESFDPDDPNTPSQPVVRVFAGGFTPVRDVVLQTVDGRRELGLHRRSYRTFELPVKELLATLPSRAKAGDDGVLEFRVVAIDIEGDVTSTKPMKLRMATAH